MPAHTPFQMGVPVHPEHLAQALGRRQEGSRAGRPRGANSWWLPGAAHLGRSLPKDGCGPGRGSGYFLLLSRGMCQPPRGHFPTGPTGKMRGRDGGQKVREKDIKMLRTLPGARAQHRVSLLGGKRHPQTEIGVPCLSAPRGPAAAKAGPRSHTGVGQFHSDPSYPLFRPQAPGALRGAGRNTCDGSPGPAPPCAQSAACRAEGCSPQAGRPGGSWPRLGAAQFIVLHRHLVDAWPPFSLISREDGSGRYRWW